MRHDPLDRQSPFVSGKRAQSEAKVSGVVKAAGGGKAIRTYGRKFSLTVTWSAPATGTAAAYLKQTVTAAASTDRFVSSGLMPAQRASTGVDVAVACT